MSLAVAVVGTLDTKGPEVGFLADRIREQGCKPVVIDVGILGEPIGVTPDVDHARVVEAGGYTLSEVRQAGSRGRAVEMMRKSVARVVDSLYHDGEIQGGIGIGGAEGAVMSASALMSLPIGVPKIVLSPIASGKHEFGPLVGTKDMLVMHTVVDILGLNPVAKTIFRNAAAAIAGMVKAGTVLENPGPEDRFVGVTMLGNTTKAVMALRERLDSHGYQAVVFHSNGVGGPAMEELAESGQFAGVIDYTTNEVADPLVGGIHDGGPDRLARVGRQGLPQVVVPGCIDFSVFHAGQIPTALSNRPTHDHNPEFTLVRTPASEMEIIGRTFGERLSQAVGPVSVVIPTRGLSIPNVPGGEFWDPEADMAFRQALTSTIRSDIAVTTADYHVNDPEFGELVADMFNELISSKEPERRES